MAREFTARQFATTQWSVVLAARGAGHPEAEAALATLCEAYWYPLYAFIRRQGYTPEDTEDLTQEFFSRLLKRDALKSIDPGKGRFRSYLLACLKHFLAKERDKRDSLKRGGKREIRSLELDYAEGRYRHEPAHDLTPDRLYDRSWAELLLSRTMNRLRREYEAAGKSRVFELLQDCLAGEKGGTPYAQLALELGLSESGIKMAVLRMRQRYGELLRKELIPLLGDASEFEDEIRHLFTAVARSPGPDLL